MNDTNQHRATAKAGPRPTAKPHCVGRRSSAHHFQLPAKGPASRVRVFVGVCILCGLRWRCGSTVRARFVGYGAPMRRPGFISKSSVSQPSAAISSMRFQLTATGDPAVPDGGRRLLP